MENYIARKIVTAKLTSLEAGQDKYRAFFIAINTYESKKAKVDEILTANGHGDCIVTE